MPLLGNSQPRKLRQKVLCQLEVKDNERLNILSFGFVGKTKVRFELPLTGGVYRRSTQQRMPTGCARSDYVAFSVNDYFNLNL
jgi:hypothetical protein